MSFGDYDDDDDDEDDDEDHDDEQDEDDDSKSDDDGEDLSDAGAAVANASPDELEAHRSMLGEVMQHMAENGIDIDEIADDAGISTSDVDALGHDDIAILTQYISQKPSRGPSDCCRPISRGTKSPRALTGGDADDIGGFTKKLF